jgi:hypothetical protein
MIVNVRVVVARGRGLRLTFTCNVKENVPGVFGIPSMIPVGRRVPW